MTVLLALVPSIGRRQILAKHAQLTSSQFVPTFNSKLSVKSDLVPTSSRLEDNFRNDLVPVRPENHAQFDLVPTSSRHWDELKHQIAHDFVPLSPLCRGEVGTRWGR